MILGFVLPCYNEEAVLEGSIERLTKLIDQLKQENKVSGDSFMLFVNDGSKDNTWRIIEEHHRKNSYVKGLDLARNSGHQTAIMAGMMQAKEMADAVITIDADLQDDLTAIPQMLQHYGEGYDVVYGVKVQREADPLMKRMSAQAFYKLQTAMGVDSVYNHADFRLMSRRALDMLEGYREKNLYLRGLIPLIGLPSATVDDVIGERQAGQSKYTLKKMLNLAIDGITSFSVKPIYLIFWLGIFFVLISLGILVYVVHALATGTAVAGWASLMLSVWFVGGAVLISLSLVGIYIGKIYTEVKNRPLYNIKTLLV
ncbi:MAG: glycosyltransferase family 2 protein [Bacteroidaceae bacterium]|nr:glycosyltransferase family 2 protein [Bacteroidaceae bacterium]